MMRSWIKYTQNMILQKLIDADSLGLEKRDKDGYRLGQMGNLAVTIMSPVAWQR